MNKTQAFLLAATTLLIGFGLGAGSFYLGRHSGQAEAPLPQTAPAAPFSDKKPTPGAKVPVAGSPEAAVQASSTSSPQQNPTPAQETREPRDVSPAPVSDVADADRALDAVKRGEFLPLGDITRIVRQRFPGRIVGVELDDDDGVAYYEFKIVTANGRVLEIEVDPKNGAIIDVDEDD